MTNKPYSVLIIEDDFRVANIDKQFVEQIEGFYVSGVVHTGQEAKAFLEQARDLPDLVLLDVYIPDVEGLELLWEIRNNYQDIDIIMITAANEVETIEQTLRGGILDYLIKPIEYARLKQTLERYANIQELLHSKQEMTQEELDALRGVSVSGDKREDKSPEDNSKEDRSKEEKSKEEKSKEEKQSKEEKSIKEKSVYPKGIDPLTLEKIVSVLRENENEGFTAVEVGKQIGASRSTARRYLEYLVSTDKVKAELIYGEVGRPERRYVMT